MKPRRNKGLLDTYFHVRSKDGVTVHWMDYEHPARRLATEEHLEVYRVDRLKGTATKIA